MLLIIGAKNKNYVNIINDMKKFLLTLSLVLCCITVKINAQVIETYFSEDFYSGLYSSEMTRIDYHDYSSENYHNDIINANSAYAYTGKGWYDLYNGNNVLAVSPGKYAKGSAADAWLITPAIELPDADNLAFTWKAYSYSEEEQDGYRILVSTTGMDKEDFVDEPLVVFDKEPSTQTTHMTSLDKYRGQTVYIAIHHNTTGFLLVVDDVQVVRLQQMEDVMTVEPATPQLASGSKVTLSGRLSTEYGSAITSATVTWKYGEETYVQEVKALSFEDGGYYSFKMDKEVEIPSSGTLAYSIDVVSGDMSASCSGEVYNAENSPYGRVAVIEEKTGSWCGWCVRGIAALEQCKQKYPNNFIGIAVHSNGSGDDVMMDASYASALSQYVDAGFPACTGNRINPFDPYPTKALEFVSKVMNQKAIAIMDVNSEINGDKINVTVNTKFAFDAKMANFNVAIALLENDVFDESNPSDYIQRNYYAGGGEGSMYGYEAKPSMMTNFVFQDVARGIFPEITGKKAYTEFTSGKDATFTYELTIPSSVLNRENLEVVALLINPETGEIMTADSNLRDMGTTGISQAANNDNINVYLSDNEVMADLTGFDGKATVTVYNLNGTLCLSKEVCGNGVEFIGTLPSDGIYIVRVNSNTLNRSFKLIY